MASSPTARSKRKQGPHDVDDRPHKQNRLLEPQDASIDNTPDNGSPEPHDSDVSPQYIPQPGDTPEWQKMIQHVVSNVVSIRFCQPCSFDTDGACASEATGFVVDSEKG